MSVPTFTKSGAKATTPAKLDKAVFAIMPENHELLKLAYDAYLANGRPNLAKTMTRGLISGGGKKPWRQKGTGRARFGSSRNPIWRGGGIVFGPTGEENHTKKMPVNAKRLAIRQALSLAASENRIRVVETIESKGKTAELVKLLTKMEAGNGSVLVVTDNKTDELVRAANNLRATNIVQAAYLNVYDIMNADSLVVSQKSLEILNEWLGGKK
ncbi:MAG: 50S ribosomal protein L4 [Candidatus Saccharimonadales bacterium]